MWNISIAFEPAAESRAARFVQRLIEQASPVHAVLFYGAEGVGKNALATTLTEHWLRRNADDERPIAAFRRGNNPDVLVIQPGGPSDLITIERIVTDKSSDVDLSLRDFFRSLPIQSHSKVAVIHRVDRMNHRAANALLKTLEEPLPHAKIILTTSEIGSVLPTIRSRCLNVACELPAIDPAESDSDAMRNLSGGSPGQYQKLTQIRPVVEELENWLGDLASAPPVAAIQLAERLASLADEVQNIEGTSARFADARILSLLAPLLAQSPTFPPEAIQTVLKTHRAIIGNANPSIALDSLVTALFALRRRSART